jgi:DNA-binding NtrC family response regulator
MAEILIVDDDADHSRVIATVLREAGHQTHAIECGGDASRAARHEARPAVILLNLRLGTVDGLEPLRQLRSAGCASPIVVLSGMVSVQHAVRAIKLGAVDVVTRPCDPSTLLESVDRALATVAIPGEDGTVLVGAGFPYVKALELARRFAPLDIGILLLGETGTGKELFARAIHAASRRAHRRFVPVDCSTLAENLIESELFGHEKGSFTGATQSRIGRFELAQGGTLFLDEIGNLPLPLQAKLLRVLQSRQIEHVGGREPIALDVRVIAATNVNLEEAIAAGQFRQDLYFRLQEAMIHLPPLRERPGDITRLACHFVAVYARQFELPVRGISPAALEILESHSWPGNARELENAMKSAVVLANDLVQPEHLPPTIAARGRSDLTSAAHGNGDSERMTFEFEFRVSEMEDIDLKALSARAAEQAERLLLQALIRHGSPTSAHLARRLSVDPKTLRLKLRRYGLRLPDAGDDARNLPTDDETLTDGIAS